MKKKSLLRKRQGFTLIELIVVVAILGILAAVIIPRVSGWRSSAEVSADQSNATMLNNAVQMYEATEGEYPTATTIGALVTLLISEDYLPSGTSVTAQSDGASFALTIVGGKVEAVTYTPAPIPVP